MITRDALASQLRDYLQHRITRAALVDWAEHAMMDEEFDDRDFETIREITGRLGLASGLVSLAFGILLVYQIGIAGGLFTGHPHWIPR